MLVNLITALKSGGKLSIEYVDNRYVIRLTFDKGSTYQNFGKSFYEAIDNLDEMLGD